jgi:hypothetical protein
LTSGSGKIVKIEFNTALRLLSASKSRHKLVVLCLGSNATATDEDIAELQVLKKGQIVVSTIGIVGADVRLLKRIGEATDGRSYMVGKLEALHNALHGELAWSHSK